HGEALNCNCLLKSSSIGNCINGAYLLNLNPNASTDLDTKDFVFLPEFTFCTETEKRFTGDFNGDGKTDILIVNNTTKNYRIVSIRQLTAAPWAAAEVIGTGNLDQYTTTKQIILGDYNGDGKVDIMIPDSEGGEGKVLWHIYYSNSNYSNGDFFTKESHNIVEYWPDTGSRYTTQQHYSSYFAIDINSDGKSDLVRVWRKYYSPGLLDFNNHNTQWQVTGFANNIGKVNVLGFSSGYDSGVFSSSSPDIPIPITSNYRYNGANTDLVVIRGHYSKIEYYQFNKNVDTENRLITVTESNGNIKQTIEYKPLEAADGGLGNPSGDFYSSEGALTYPNIEIIRNPIGFMVSKLTATINGASKYQDFRYRGYVFNFNYGTVGFVKTTRSSWYLSESDPRIWATQFNDVALKGANTITWSSTDGTTVFNSVPSNLLSTKTNVFAVYTEGGGDAISSRTIQNNIIIQDPVTVGQTYKASSSITASSKINDDVAVTYQAPQIILKPGFIASATNNSKFTASPTTNSQSTGSSNSNSGVYNVLLTKQTSIDHLTGVKNETNFTYDGTVESTNYFGLQVRSVSKQYSGATLQGTTTVDTDYDNNPDGTGSAYYVGRPKKVNSSSTIYTGDTRSSEEKYTYTGSNLTRSEKKGHNTYPIIEDMTYDSLGNLLTKTVSAPGASTPAIPRTITNEYDSTKRFVIKKTDRHGFITNFIYNTLGQVTKSTDYLGVVNDYVYDNWGKLINTTTQNVSSTPLVTTIIYTKLSDGGYTTTTTNNTDAKTSTRYDVLGRAIVTSTKGFTSGSLVYKQIVYDALGRKIKESEPYFSSPNQWTVYEYDNLMRPTTVTSHTGKIQTLSYAGLTTISNDDGKITTITVDALGNKTQTTDPGGAVNFIYYASGQLKESDYLGNKVSIS
ncbi:MAG: VCBS repeat-containing protein, partial [Flavobacterium sp.]